MSACFPSVQWGAALGASLAAAVWDLRTRRIPNLLTGPVFVAGIAYAGWTDGGSGAGSALAASILVSLPCLVLYALGGGGAGDVKLMAGIGAWLGVSHGLMTLASVSLWGVVLGILRAVLSGKSAALASNLNALVRIPLQFVLAGLGIRRPLDLAAAPHPSVGTMPYGGAIGLGVITASLGDWLWHA